MTKTDLARQLRARLARRPEFASRAERRRLDRTPDVAIIDAYVTCSDCGTKQVAGPALEQLIAHVTSADAFVSHLDSSHADRPPASRGSMETLN